MTDTTRGGMFSVSPGLRRLTADGPATPLKPANGGAAACAWVILAGTINNRWH